MSRSVELIASVDGIDEIRTTRYRCQGCGRSASKRKSLEGHKATCWKHPDNKGCGSCALVRRTWDDDMSKRPTTRCALGLEAVSVSPCFSCKGHGYWDRPGSSPERQDCTVCHGSGEAVALTFNCPKWSTDCPNDLYDEDGAA